MKKNYQIRLRLNQEQISLIKEISRQTRFKETAIARWLLNKALSELKEDIRKAKGIENLSFNVFEIKKINE